MIVPERGRRGERERERKREITYFLRFEKEREAQSFLADELSRYFSPPVYRENRVRNTGGCSRIQLPPVTAENWGRTVDTRQRR